jgi:hypothetical protein
MPKGGPRIGRDVFNAPPVNPKLDSATEELVVGLPQPQEIGTISREALNTLIDKVPRPPWETDPQYDRHDSDARKFLECGPEFTLRWLNPKLVSQTGLRHWQAVPARGDRRFKLKLASLMAPDNTIRRGDHGGDFLAWMYTEWVESNTKRKMARNSREKQKASEQYQTTREAINRGKFSPYIRSEEGLHPTHTIADGRMMEKG